MLKKEETTCAVSRLEFWDRLNEEQKELLLKNTRKVSYPQGHNLYSTVEECLGVLLIQSGDLRAYLLSEDGREITLFWMAAGETCVLSASCILNNISFELHIDAESQTDALLIPSSIFARLKEQNVYVENFLYKQSAERFSDVMWAMEQLLFMSLDKRLAVFLVDEMARTRREELHLTQEQIARYIGSAREVVSRTLKSFQAEGSIQQSRGVIRVLDKKKLLEHLK